MHRYAFHHDVIVWTMNDVMMHYDTVDAVMMSSLFSGRNVTIYWSDCAVLRVVTEDIPSMVRSTKFPSTSLSVQNIRVKITLNIVIKIKILCCIILGDKNYFIKLELCMSWTRGFKTVVLSSM